MGIPMTKFNNVTKQQTNPSQQNMITNNINVEKDSNFMVIADEEESISKANTKPEPEQSYSGDANFGRLKYIDESSEEATATTPTTDKDELLLLDNDSGNASISDVDQNSHRDEEHSSISDDDPQQKQPMVKLRKHCSTFSFPTLNLTNRFSSINLFNQRRYSTQNFLSSSSVESVNFKSILKANCGDLIEIRCICNCQRSGINHLRASINNRQKFRRSLHRQSFHKTSPTKHSILISKRSQSSFLNLPQLFTRSCIRGSIDDLNQIIHYQNNESKTLFSGTLKSNSDYCSEQFHYVYIDKMDHNQRPPNVWCFHVKPFQRFGLLDDDRNLGIIRHEPLDLLVGQMMFETEERHWQRGRSFKQPKLMVQCQIRNQGKLSRSILRQTLNVSPDVDRIRNVLFEYKDCYVRYHKTLLNSEHYVTLWKYGIGWSTWANNRADILRALQHFVERFSRLVLNDHQQPSKVQLQGGECLLLDQSINLIVQCFGLQDFKVEHAIRQWIQCQVVIGNNNHLSVKPIMMIVDHSLKDKIEEGLQEEKEREQQQKQTIESISDMMSTMRIDINAT